MLDVWLDSENTALRNRRILFVPLYLFCLRFGPVAFELFIKQR